MATIGHYSIIDIIRSFEFKFHSESSAILAEGEALLPPLSGIGLTVTAWPVLQLGNNTIRGSLEPTVCRTSHMGTS